MHYSIRDQNDSLRDIAEKFGTPLYIYDCMEIQKNYTELKNSCTNHVEIFYSLKANPNLAISASLKKMGAGAEVCSGFELQSALIAGYSPENILFVGPLKKPEEIIYALEKNIYAIVCESKEELIFINELAKTRRVVANVAIRINPSFAVRDASLKMGGVPSQFGIDQEDVFKNKNFFLKKKSVNIIGIHVFNGTRILQATQFYENTRRILELSDELENKWGVSFSMLDIGGGIGVPYFQNETEFDVAELKKIISPLIFNYKERHILESGRYLVATAGVFVCRIGSIKVSKNVTFLITDGGMNCHLTAAGYGSVLKRNFPITLLAKSKSTKQVSYHIAGPLCTPADLIGRDVMLPEAKVGDYIVIFVSGAYGPTASPILFLGHGHPAETFIDQNEVKIIRERDIMDDVFRKQKMN
jgi:diaminopimelate decarboxylase